jgi:hypothetical protein
MAPAMAVPKVPVPYVEVEQLPISVLELKLLIERFIGAYERGDLEGFLGLFAEQAHTNAQGGKAAIRRDYGNLFYTTQSRHISLSSLRWHREPGLARGESYFLVKTQNRGERWFKEYSGSIRFEVEKRNGELLIKGLYHAVEVFPNPGPAWTGDWNRGNP